MRVQWVKNHSPFHCLWGELNQFLGVLYCNLLQLPHVCRWPTSAKNFLKKHRKIEVYNRHDAPLAPHLENIHCSTPNLETPIESFDLLGQTLQSPCHNSQGRALFLNKSLPHYNLFLFWKDSNR